MLLVGLKNCSVISVQMFSIKSLNGPPASYAFSPMNLARKGLSSDEDKYFVLLLNVCLNSCSNNESLEFSLSNLSNVSPPEYFLIHFIATN